MQNRKFLVICLVALMVVVFSITATTSGEQLNCEASSSGCYSRYEETTCVF